MKSESVKKEAEPKASLAVPTDVLERLVIENDRLRVENQALRDGSLSSAEALEKLAAKIDVAVPRDPRPVNAPLKNRRPAK